QVGARAKQLEAGLITDLDPPAGEQRDRAAQVGQLGALAKVELGARGAKLIVEVMQRRERALADVAVLPLTRLAGGIGIVQVLGVERLGRHRWKDVGAGEDRSAAQAPDAGAVPGRLLPLDPLRLPA